MSRVQLDPNRVQVKFMKHRLNKKLGTGEVVALEMDDKDGMCYRILRHDDRVVEWYPADAFEVVKGAA